MLYDPKWEQKTKADTDPVNLESLIAWLEKQPTDKTYCYLNTGKCLLGTYFTAMGFERVNVGPQFFYYGANQLATHNIPEAMNRVAVGEPHTFGAALKRARAALT